MADIASELRRWLDLDVRLGSPTLGDDRLTMTLNDVPADVALDTIARMLSTSVIRAARPIRDARVAPKLV